MSLEPCDAEARRALWNALLEGTATLVEWYDEGGRRFVVARRSENRTRLSEIERTVVDWVAAGRAQKIVAMELGLAPSSVSDALARAIQKLGLTCVSELTRVAAALTRSAQ